MAPFDFKSSNHFVASSDGTTLQVHELTANHMVHPFSIRKAHWKQVANINMTSLEDDDDPDEETEQISYDGLLFFDGHGRTEGSKALTVLAKHPKGLRLLVNPEGYCFEESMEFADYADFGIHYVRLNDLFSWPHHRVNLATTSVWSRSELKYQVPKPKRTTTADHDRHHQGVNYLQKKLEELKRQLKEKDEELEKADEVKDGELEKLRKEKDEEMRVLKKKKDEEKEKVRKAEEALEKLKVEMKNAKEELKIIQEKNEELQKITQENNNETTRIKKDLEEQSSKLQQIIREKIEELQKITREKNDEIAKNKKDSEEQGSKLRQITQEKNNDIARIKKDLVDQSFKLQKITREKNDEITNITKDLEQCAKSSWAISPSVRYLPMGSEGERLHLSRRRKVPPETFIYSEKPYDFLSSNIPRMEPHLYVPNGVQFVDEESSGWPSPTSFHVVIGKNNRGFDKNNWWFAKTNHPEGGMTMLAYYDGNFSQLITSGPSRTIRLPFLKDATLVPVKPFFLIDIHSFGVKLAFMYRV
ncbi:Laminin subunit alpha-2 [Linum grandiflorum]